MRQLIPSYICNTLMQVKLIIGVLMLFALMAAAACTGNRPCLKYSTVAATAAFRSSKDTVIKDSNLANLYLIYPAISAAQKYKNTNKVSFILNTKTNATQVLLAADSLAQPFDTLTIFAKQKLHFVSKECGYNYFFDIDSIAYSKNKIRKITLQDIAVDDNTGKIHMAILF
jgi:Family of unknown function (DUF6452)